MSINDKESNLIVIESKKDYMLSNDIYVLEVEHKEGKGMITLFNSYKVIGKKLFYLRSAQLSLQSNLTLTLLPMAVKKNTSVSKLRVNMKLSESF